MGPSRGIIDDAPLELQGNSRRPITKGILISMQRLLVGLVLVLFVAVAALGVAVYKLGDSAPSSRPPPPARTAAVIPEHDPAVAAREAEFERRITLLQEELAAVKRELRSRPTVPAATPPVESGGGGVGEGGFVSAPGVRPRDPEGQLVVTEEDAEFFAKVQEKVLRQQRIDGQTRSAMARVDRMITRGEIAPLAADRKLEVERVLGKYVGAGDDLTQRLLRTPDDEAKGLTSEQRRDELSQARTQLLAAAQQELEPLLGADDAKRIAEESLQRPWGLGRQGRRFEDQR
jgi:hypothetical protein